MRQLLIEKALVSLDYTYGNSEQIQWTL